MFKANNHVNHGLILNYKRLTPGVLHQRRPSASADAAERCVELVLEPGVLRQVMLVDAHAVAVQDSASGRKKKGQEEGYRPL